MQIITIFGPPLSGKGTLSTALAADGYHHFSSGDHIKARIRAGDERYDSKVVFGGGILANDAILVDTVVAIKEQLAAGARGIILDGVPRNPQQAARLNQLMKDAGVAMPMIAIELVVPFEILDARRLKRIGEFATAGKEPRKDDNKDIFEHRLEVYTAETAPLTEHYQALGNLYQIDSARDEQSTQADMRRILRNLAQAKPATGPCGPAPSCPAP